MIPLGILTSKSGETPIVTTGLIAYYDAGNNVSYSGTGSIWYDISGNTLNANLINNPVYSSLNGGNFIIEKVFNNYVTIPHNVLFNFPTGMTISVWVKTTNAVDGYLATKGENSFFFCIGPTGTTSGKASLFLQGTSGSWAQSATTISTGNWVNISVTWNGTSTIFYVNGAIDSTSTRPGTMATGTSPVYFCWRNTPLLNGNIAIYMFYNRALTASEILQNYNSKKARYGL